MYPRLPEPDPTTPDEPIALYGVRILRFVMQHDGLTATCDDRALELADHFYPLAIQGATPATADAAANAHRAIAAAIRRRRKAAQDDAQTTTTPAAIPPAPSIGGHRVKLPPPAPRPIAPQHLIADPF